ncbi:phospholipase-like, Aminotransferase-like mobile domain protein [Artemisia annua]|uniref:Phospholipase-like, Aminotransferase-like mobile domain protein n=1 Tax=Artemisia annua TaxID=35608 RepID=A0A2U1Q2Q7_ARTAN|nr:phospholipase-like, Aminotransferase-like mobile domain protein [Artemisia annua]
MIDYILKKQGHVDAHHYDMPLIYHIDGRSLHFGRQEFSIIMGFRFGTASSGLHHYGEVVFMGRLLTDHVEDTLLRLVENLDEWNAYPWGEHIWRHLYNQLLNVVHKQKWTHLHGLNRVSNYIPSYTLSGFVWVFKIWILESFESSIEWWNKSPNVTPRGIAWTRRQIFKRYDFSALFGKRSSNLIGMFYREFAMEYVPRAPPNRVSHPYDVYLKKCAERRKRGRIRYSELPSIDRSETSITKELMLKDHVITQMNARLFKLEAIIQVLGHDKCGGVLEYILQEEIRLRLDEEERWRLEEERINEEENRMRLEEEKQIIAKQEKLLLYQSEKKKKAKEVMNSEHMKMYRNRLAPAKWTHGSGEVSAYYWLKKYEQSEKKRSFGIVDPDMTDLLRYVEPWIEDLSRCDSSIDRVHFSEAYDMFLGQPGPLHCKFPWCQDVRVDRRFWESLVCVDPPRKGWVMDEHIELWVAYMWHVRPSHANWAMVSSYFVQLLLQDSLPLWYADGKTYSIPWSDVDKVIIPINEPKKHWLVAQFDIRTGVVTVYDSGQTFKVEWRDWYVSLRECLKVIVNDFGLGYGARRSHTTPFTLTYDKGYFGYLYLVDNNFTLKPLNLVVPSFPRSHDNKNFSYLDLSAVGTSQGIWCFHSFYKIVVIWNPSLNKSVGLIVPTLLSHRVGHKSYIAFGVSPNNMDPTVLHISLPTKGHGRLFVSWFSFNTKHWHPLDHEKLPRESIRIKRSSQAVIGRYIFWVASEKHVQNESTGYCYKRFLIMSFDLISMTFQEVEIPESIRVHLPIPFTLLAHGDALVVCGNILTDVNNVFCVRILELQGASLTGRMLRSFTHQSHCCLRLLGFTKFEEPIVEVETPFQSEHTLEVYQHWSDQFHNVQLPIVLKKTNVFHTKGLDQKTYTISFKNAERVPKQRGIFGDCGIWACFFLYRLSHGKSLDVEDPIQVALSYREQMASFYFKHKVATW